MRKVRGKLERSNMILPADIEKFLGKIRTMAIKNKKTIFANSIGFCTLDKVFNPSNSKSIVNKAS